MIPMMAKAGAALVWESRTWHCAGAHTSEKLRCSIGHVYGLACAKPHDLYPAVLHDDVYVRLSDDEKRLLGFEVAFEYAGHIGPRSPTDARSNIAAKVPYIPELRRGGANPRSP
jgi:ectoine hydroxylase-related dioxygenase (phytanoyl-CoA dioxygenase family)